MKDYRSLKVHTKKKNPLNLESCKGQQVKFSYPVDFWKMKILYIEEYTIMAILNLNSTILHAVVDFGLSFLLFHLNRYGHTVSSNRD